MRARRRRYIGLRLEAETGQPNVSEAVKSAVDTFMRAFTRRDSVR